MKKLFLISILFVYGCATSKITYLPDGSEGHSIDCSGNGLTWGDCEVKAGEICKEKGYEIITEGSDVSSSATATETTAFASSKVSRTLLIKCGE